MQLVTNQGVAAANDRAHHAADGGISVVIVSCNEADVIADCLRSVTDWADEIIVVDMHSTDGTRAIARQYGARLIDHEHVAYVEPVRNFAITQAENAWILVLDPDERIPQPLAQKLRQIAEEKAFDVILLPYRNMAFGKTLTAPGIAEVPHARFFRRGSLSWSSNVHSLPDLTNLRSFTLQETGPDMSILHNTWRTVSQVLDKTHRYAARDAEGLRTGGQRFSMLNLLLTPAYIFVHQFIRGKGYQDGMAGLLKVLLLATYYVAVHAELWELEGQPKVFDRQVARWGSLLRAAYLPLVPAEHAVMMLRKTMLRRSVSRAPSK